MHRRQFLLKSAKSGAAGASIAIASSIAAPAIAQNSPEIQWRLVSSFPKTKGFQFEAMQIFAQLVAESTDHRFEIQPFAAGEIIPGAQALDAVSSGAVECCHTSLQYYQDKDPTLSLASGYPFGPNARIQEAWWHFSSGEEQINSLLEKWKIIAISAGNSEKKIGAWFKKELLTPYDLQNIKLSIEGAGEELWKKLGITKEKIATKELSSAFEQGLVDAAECLGSELETGIGSFANLYYPCFWGGAQMLHICINKDEWSKIPKHYQIIIKNAVSISGSWMKIKQDASSALEKLPVQMHNFPESIIDAAYNITKSQHEERSSQSQLYKKTFSSIEVFLKSQSPLWNAKEYSYDKYMLAKNLA